MNFKRVLVFVMALVMMVSVCVPAVSAAFKHEIKHEHLEEALNDPELVAKYEEIKGVVDYVVKDIEENHEEYYAIGFAYANENGYISGAIGALKLTLETLPQINLEDAPVTDEMRADLQTELDALAPTIEKLLAILESGEASDFDGFVNAALTLEGDLYTHLNNIYAILEQGSIELNQFVLVPAFNQLMKVLEEEVLPKLEETINAYVDAVVDHVVEKLTPYYEKVVEIYGIARDTYNRLVEIIVMIDLYVQDKIDMVVNAYNSVVATLLNIYGTIEDAVRTACEVYHKIVNTVVEFNARVENTIAEATKIYRYTVNLLIEVYGHVKNAVIVANQILEFFVENRPLMEEGIKNGIEIAGEFYDFAVEVLTEAYESNEDVYYIASRLCAYVANVIKEVNDSVDDTLNGALNGNYELKDESYYVSFGNAPYADALAGKLNLANKHDSVSFENDYLESLVKADLVTVKLDNGSFVNLMEAQIEGKLAEIVRSNEDLMAWYTGLDELSAAVSGWWWLPENMREGIVNGIFDTKNTINSFVDLDAEPVELDWDKYLDAEGKAALDSLLAELRVKVIEEGLDEYYYLDINPIMEELLTENGLGGIFTLTFDPIVIPQADLLVFAVENMIYGYAEFVGNITSVIENASDDATIVLTPVNNPLIGYSFKGQDLSGLAEDVQPIVDLLNANLYGFALTNENVIYVDVEDADAIYDALNMYCNHVHDSCLDTFCDRCLSTMDPLGHTFTNYVFDNNSTCAKNGTETAKCDFCDATDTREALNTTLPHEWVDATCKTPKTCKKCGAIFDDTLADHTWVDATCITPKTCSVCNTKADDVLAPHVLGDWRITKDPTSNAEGTRERKCLTKDCEYKEVEAIPFDTLSTIAVVGIIFACVAVAGGISATVAGILKKKNKI